MSRLLHARDTSKTEIKFAVEDTSKSMSEEEKGPYQFVFLQECTYMNSLVGEMARSLGELQLGFKGKLVDRIIISFAINMIQWLL